jgi:hypothetical protein
MAAAVVVKEGWASLRLPGVRYFGMLMIEAFICFIQAGKEVAHVGCIHRFYTILLMVG